MIEFQYNDGGREEAGYRGLAGDCVVRAISIATECPYPVVYQTLRELSGKTPRDGVVMKFVHQYFNEIGWKWRPTMMIGHGCRTHVRADELPKGRLVLRLSKHLTAVLDGVLHDTYDCSRDGQRCVYGFWSKG